MSAHIVHFNAAPTDWPTQPAGALIPLCRCDGDKPEDDYTLDASAITCCDCRDELAYRAWHATHPYRPSAFGG